MARSNKSVRANGEAIASPEVLDQSGASLDEARAGARQTIDARFKGPDARKRAQRMLRSILEDGASPRELQSFATYLREGRAGNNWDIPFPQGQPDPAHLAGYWAAYGIVVALPYDEATYNLLAQMARRGLLTRPFHEVRSARRNPAARYAQTLHAIASNCFKEFRYDLDNPYIARQLRGLNAAQQARWILDETSTGQDPSVPESWEYASCVARGELQYLLNERTLTEDLSTLLLSAGDCPLDALTRWQADRRLLGLMHGGVTPADSHQLSAEAQQIGRLHDLAHEAATLNPEVLRAARQSYALAEDLLRIWKCASESLRENRFALHGEVSLPRNRLEQHESARRKLDRLAYRFRESPVIVDAVQRITEALIAAGDNDHENEISVTDTDDPETLIQIGSVPVYTCQHYEHGSERRCLWAYVIDADKKVVLVRNRGGRILARAILRLVTHDQTEESALCLEPVYTSVRNSSRMRAFIEHHVLAKAAALGIRAYGSSRDDGTRFRLAPSQNLIQYTDSGLGTVRNDGLATGRITAQLLQPASGPRFASSVPWLDRRVVVRERLRSAGVDDNRVASREHLRALKGATALSDRIAVLTSQDFGEIESEGLTAQDWVAVEYMARGGMSESEAQARSARELRRMDFDPEYAATVELILALAVQRREGIDLAAAWDRVRTEMNLGFWNLQANRVSLRWAYQLTEGARLEDILAQEESLVLPSFELEGDPARLPTVGDIAAWWYPARGVCIPEAPALERSRLGSSVKELMETGRRRISSGGTAGPAKDLLTNDSLATVLGISSIGNTNDVALETLILAEAKHFYHVPDETLESWLTDPGRGDRGELAFGKRGMKATKPTYRGRLDYQRDLIALGVLRRSFRSAPAAGVTPLPLTFQEARSIGDSEGARMHLRLRNDNKISLGAAYIARLVENGVPILDAHRVACMEFADENLDWR